jgi:hypothetical protein
LGAGRVGVRPSFASSPPTAHGVEVDYEKVRQTRDRTKHPWTRGNGRATMLIRLHFQSFGYGRELGRAFVEQHGRDDAQARLLTRRGSHLRRGCCASLRRLRVPLSPWRIGHLVCAELGRGAAGHGPRRLACGPLVAPRWLRLRGLSHVCLRTWCECPARWCLRLLARRMAQPSWSPDIERSAGRCSVLSASRSV